MSEVGPIQADKLNVVNEEMSRRQELALFLRARREQLQPEDLGLERRGRRRVRGLRREEVATLACVSVTLYAWLEQGRDVYVSVPALDAVCRALQLDQDQWDYVRRLAHRPDDFCATPTSAGPTLETLLDDMLPRPASVVTASYDLLAWNAAYTVLFGDPMDLPLGHRNLLWMSFVEGHFREYVVGWPEVARASIAFLRDMTANHAGDTRLRSVIADLGHSSAEFRDAWSLLEVRRSLSQMLTRIHHPEIGDLQVRVLQLSPTDEPGVTLIVHYPVDERSRERLAAWVATACR